MNIARMAPGTSFEKLEDLAANDEKWFYDAHCGAEVPAWRLRAFWRAYLRGGDGFFGLPIGRLRIDLYAGELGLHTRLEAAGALASGGRRQITL